MPFVLGARKDFAVAVDSVELTLRFRRFGDEPVEAHKGKTEREVYDEKWLRVVNDPAMQASSAAPRFLARRRAFCKEVAGLLMEGWDGMMGCDGEVPFSPEARDQFLHDPEARRLWEPGISQYLWPSAALVPEPYVLGGQRKHRVAIEVFGLVLTFREPTGDERGDFDKKWAKLVNAPGSVGLDALVRASLRQRALLREFAHLLLAGWEGVCDGKGKPIAFSPEGAAEFFESPEARRLADTALRQYLWPATTPVQPEEEEFEPSFR
jgi:hypothetical protein